jgi:hypothetical protein
MNNFDEFRAVLLNLHAHPSGPSRALETPGNAIGQPPTAPQELLKLFVLDVLLHEEQEF